MEADGYMSYKLSSPFVEYMERPSLLREMDACGGVSGQDVLDLACGWGMYTMDIAKRFPRHITAMDLSPSMIARAKAYTQPISDRVPIRFMQVNSNDLRDSNQYHLILANFLLPFAKTLTDLKKTAFTIFRALKENGKVIGFIPNTGDSSLDFKSIQKFGFTCDIPPNVKTSDTCRVQFYDQQENIALSSTFQWYPLEEIEAIFRQIGYKSIQFCPPLVHEDGVNKFGLEYWEDFFLPQPRALLFQASK